MPEILETMNINVSEVVSYGRITGNFEKELRAVVERKIARQAGLEAGLSASESELQKVFDLWRLSQQLHKAEDTKKWLAARDLTLEDVENFLDTNLLVSKLKDKLVAECTIDNYLKHPKVQEMIRELVYSDWLRKQLE